MRHSTAHLLAAAVAKLWPKTKFGVGPAIENGFYYDFEFPQKITEEDLLKIEQKMKEIAGKGISFEQTEMSIDESLKFEKRRGQIYKQELIEQINRLGSTSMEKEALEEIGREKINKVNYYKLGEFIDLCRGPHVKTTKEIGSFKLLNIAGSYWRGSENNPMLTRIYGTVWPSKKELDNHLIQQEEIKKRDHKKIGLEQELFMFHETAPGMPYWLPKGLTLLNVLTNFWRKTYLKEDYYEISSPLINEKKLWETSGHWKFYKDDMFVIQVDKQTTYGVKPMNCPNAMIVFGSKQRSYKDLPLRLADIDQIHRFERSGTLNGLFRTRQFQQDDAHIFITEEQIAGEYEKILKLADKFYSIFNLSYSLRLGTRPDKYLGEKVVWDKAEVILKNILEKSGREYSILEGDGAFYGPKIDILMKDSLGREWQMGTVQLDFHLPKRFKLKYIANNGSKQTPVVIHHVIYGALGRFIGILTEHYFGAFPLWLSPIQAVVIPITERNNQYAKDLRNQLFDNDFRVEIDSRNETMQTKIRNAQLQKIPYMLVIGDREQVQKKVAIRSRKKGDEGVVSISDLITRLKDEVENKS